MPAHLLTLVANERPLINIDITLVLNLCVWIGLFLFLRAVLWKPMLDLIDAREQGTEGSRHDATRLAGESRELKAKLESDLSAARAAAAEERKRLTDEGRARDAELTAKVRDEVAASVESQRAELMKQKAAIRAEIMAAVPGIAAEIASKVLRREVRS